MQNNDSYLFGCIRELRNTIREKKYPNGVNEETFANYLGSQEGQHFLVETLNKKAPLFLDRLSQCILQNDEQEKSRQVNLHNHLESTWGEGFSWLRLYFCVSHEITTDYLQSIDPNYSDLCNKHTFTALSLLHGKALLWYNTIRCLLENGYPDGAIAQWRTLYELWAVSELIYNDTDDVAKAFLESANDKITQESSHYKWAKTSNRFSSDDKNVTISAIVNEAHKTHKITHGIDTSNRKLNELYMFSNYIIHPSALGVINRVSESYSGEMITEGVDTNLSTPAINSSIYMFYITKRFMSSVTNEISTVGTRVLSDIIREKIQTIFEKSHTNQQS